MEPRSVPISFAQARLWFVDRLESAGCAYHNANTVRLRGPLRRDVAQRSLEAIVARHEPLRTSFHEVEGEPQARVRDALAVDLPVADLSGLAPGERDAEAARRARACARAPFDLARAPLFRFELLRLAPDDHLLVYVVHHIVSDRWSVGVFLRELDELYAAFAAGRPSPLPPLPARYAELAARQRERLGSGGSDAALAFWRDRLGDRPPLLDLPGPPRPPLQTFRGATHTRRLAPALLARVRELARREGASLFMVLRAAFEVLLARYARSRDFVVGTPDAGRTDTDSEPLVGLFVNVLPLRADLSGRPSFRELVRRVRGHLLDAHAHRDLPFELLVERLDLPRDLGRPPLCSVLFNLHNVPMPATTRSGLGLELGEVDLGVSRFDLSLTTRVAGDALTCEFEYNRDLLEAPAAARMAGHYEALLGAACADPERPVADLPMLTAAERRTRPARGPDATAAHPCVHELVAARARRHPGRVAVEDDTKAWTYADLDARARGVAAALDARGVGPGDVVGIGVERGAAMVAAVLGIHRAGAAFLPLDPEYPRPRLALMLEDAGVAALVTDRPSAPALPPVAAPVVELEDAPRDGPDLARARPDDLAYLLYTSGSTGRPKGVRVPHRALSNFLVSMRRRPGFEARDVLAAVTTLSFDIAMLELFLPLASGGRVVVLGRAVAADGPRLVRALRERGITVFQGTPSTWRLLVEAGGPPPLRGLSGGETLPRPLAETLLARGVELWNLYGPTETTIYSTCGRVESGSGPVPLGEPIDATRLLVLEPGGQPAPVGVPGELFIGGDGLAQGYHGRPDLTAERFVADPFGPGRLYRSGDLVRYREDGALLFLGRIDFQVKVRGHRIELGEVEAALRRHEGVRDAVAVADGERLVAHVVPEGEPPTVTGLRRFLAESLPAAMVPSVFNALPRLPLTPNGKIDRKALPAVAAGRPGVAAGLVAPRDDTERRLARIFQSALGIDRVGVRDDFFDLGGHSMLVMRVLARVEREFGKRPPLVDFFRRPCVEGLARLLVGEGREVWSC